MLNSSFAMPAILQTDNFIMQLCGNAGYKHWTTVWEHLSLTHTHLTNTLPQHRKTHEFIPSFTRLRINLWTVFQHLFSFPTPVDHLFMHTIHSAYKENNNLKKGIILI